MSPESRKEAVASEWGRAEEALAEAEILHGAGKPVGTVSRAYYAAFHAAQALLFTLGLQPKTHQGVRSLLGLHLVRTGKLPAEQARALAYAATDREDADYDTGAFFRREDADRALQRSKEFLAVAKRILTNDGWSLGE